MSISTKVKYPENETDQMWIWETSRIIPWLSGKGADIGSGKRSALKDSIRVDIDEKVEPDVIASGDKLPFKDGELDYISAVHAFEHFEDQYKLIKEWIRVIKKGGIIAIVHPDVEYTKEQKPVEENDGLRENPHNYHYHEKTKEEFIKMIEEWEELEIKIVDSGIACGNWSFYVIIEKI